jgi:hypothetical protein
VAGIDYPADTEIWNREILEKDERGGCGIHFGTRIHVWSNFKGKYWTEYAIPCLTTCYVDVEVTIAAEIFKPSGMTVFRTGKRYQRLAFAGIWSPDANSECWAAGPITFKKDKSANRSLREEGRATALEAFEGMLIEVRKSPVPITYRGDGRRCGCFPHFHIRYIGALRLYPKEGDIV